MTAADTHPPELESGAARNRRDWPWLVFFALMLCTQIGPWWYLERDATAYLSSARSLARNGQVSSLGEHGFGGVTTFPALIAPAFLTGDRPFLMLSIIQCALGIAALIGVYFWAGRVLPDVRILVTALAFGNTMFLLHLRRPLKETAVLACLVWTVNAMHAALRAKGSGRALCHGLLVAFLTALMISLRITTAVFAMVFVAVTVGTAIRHRERRTVLATMLLGYLLPAILGVGLILTRDNGATVNAALELIERAWTFAAGHDATVVLDGARREMSEVGRVTLPGMFKAYTSSTSWLHPLTLLYASWSLVIGYGWWCLVRERGARDVFLLGMPIYIGAYTIWPFDQGARFVVVMLPAAMAASWVGMARPLRLKPIFLVLCVIAQSTVGFGYWWIVDRPRAIAHHAQWEVVDGIVECIPPNVEVSACGVDWQFLCMLRLELDRPVNLVPPTEFAPSNAWVVVGPHQSTPPTHRVVGAVRDHRVVTSTGPSNHGGTITSGESSSSRN